MSIVSEELRRYFLINGIRNNDVCDATGISKAAVSHIVTGTRPISKDNAHTLAQVYGFNIDFLLWGKGTLMPASRQDAPADSRPAPSSSAEPAGLEAENRALHNEVAELTREKITLKARIYQLIDRLEKHGIPCGEKE